MPTVYKVLSVSTPDALEQAMNALGREGYAVELFVPCRSDDVWVIGQQDMPRDHSAPTHQHTCLECRATVRCERTDCDSTEGETICDPCWAQIKAEIIRYGGRV